MENDKIIGVEDINDIRDCSTMGDLLMFRAKLTPDKHAYSYLKNGIDEDVTITYKQLDIAAKAVAASISTMLSPGDRALVIYPSGIDFIIGFFGCIYAGVLPVPTPPPDPTRLKRTVPRLMAIVKDAEARLVLTIDAISKQLEGSEFDTIHRLATDTIKGEDADTKASAWKPVIPPVNSNDIAYLQYTSGSTGIPKGVILTHANIVHHLSILQQGFGYTPESVSVVWMPNFHDYGLVDGLLAPLYNGTPAYIMSPLTFIRNPFLWLKAIDRYRGTTTQAPNFAYERCIEKITEKQKLELDLSSMRVASNGAEPVRRETVLRFIAEFGKCGFPAEAFYPAYGMAETTLVVSTRPHSKEDIKMCHVDPVALEHEYRIVEVEPNQIRDSRWIISCGKPIGTMNVVIANTKTKAKCKDFEVGEIWISDPSVSQGYWHRPEETQKIFGCRLSDSPEEGPFLDTGDLGFMKDGELYFTGRVKDLVIIDGVNHYPQDIEWTVESSHPDIMPGQCVAFSINDETVGEKLVVLAEVRKELEDWETLFTAVRRAIAESHELTLHAFVALKKGGIYKTSSGKVQRKGCSAAYLKGNLDAYAVWNKPTRKDDSSIIQIESYKAISREELRIWLTKALARQLDLPETSINVNSTFADHGLSSRSGVEMVGELEDWLKKEGYISQDFLKAHELSNTLLWEYPSIEILSQYLSQYLSGKTFNPELACTLEAPFDCDNRIAIVSMSFRFPEADNVTDFWNLLKSRKIAIKNLPTERWSGFQKSITKGDGLGEIATLRGGFLDSVDKFDTTLFGIAHREAEVMDPQQRILLEVAWEAFERANININTLAGSDAGVFVGISSDDYSFWQMGEPNTISAYTGTGKALCIAANRISYQFDFRGPSMAIDTACSSSLVAIHQACQSLRRGECSIALAGGINLILSPHMSIALSQGGFLSPDGLCKTFDDSANGYVRSEGCGLLVLKRLSDAQRDGDNVLAVIRGSAVNQDGRSNGLTAPNGQAQQQVIMNALKVAGVKPSEISYVETHGTGTSLGDPIEVRALQAVLSQGRSPDNRCYLGAIKANIGHLEAAAGIAGIVKTVLSMVHREITPHPNLQKLNQMIKLEGTPFSIPVTSHSWIEEMAGNRGTDSGKEGEKSSRTDGGKNNETNNEKDRATDNCNSPLLAGVSSFGFGGTNAHIILESSPITLSSSHGVASQIAATNSSITETANSLSDYSETKDIHCILPLSAMDTLSLRAIALSWSEYLKSDSSAPLTLTDLCYSASVSRASFPQRFVVSGSNKEDIISTLDSYLDSYNDEDSLKALQTAPRVAFFFTGQGSQYPEMGKELYETEPTFRESITECDKILAPIIKISLIDLLYGSNPASAEELAQTEITQPVIFALEYSLAKMWINWGVKPTALLGHSVGEYVAACVAGVFSLSDGLKLVAERAKLVKSAPGDGTMVAVMANSSRIQTAIDSVKDRFISSDVVIGCYNGPKNNVLSGSRQALEKVEKILTQDGFEIRQLAVSHAFHSPMMDPILGEFAKIAHSIKYSEPNSNTIIPIYSNVTGEAAGKEMAKADYWITHLRSPVEFQSAIESLLKDGVDICLEVGPKPTLIAMAQHIKKSVNSNNSSISLWLPTLRPKTTDWQQILKSAGTMFILGVQLDWKNLFKSLHPNHNHKRVDIPIYPFQHKSYWLPNPTSSWTDSTPKPYTESKDYLIGMDDVNIASNGYRFPGHKIDSPLIDKIIFENYYNTQSMSWIAEHRVFGQIVVPGAAHISLLIEAAAHLYGDVPCTFSDIIFPQPLIISENGGRKVQLATEKTDNDDKADKTNTPVGNEFRLISLPNGRKIKLSESGNSAWQEHATGRIVQGDIAYTKDQNKDKDSNKEIDLQKLQSICPDKIDKNFYKDIWQTAIELGKSFCWVKELWQGKNMVIALLSNPKDNQKKTLTNSHFSILDDSNSYNPNSDNSNFHNSQEDNYRLSPGLIDSMLQILAVIIKLQPDEAVVPFGFESFKWHGIRHTNQLWSHIELRHSSDSFNSFNEDAQSFNHKDLIEQTKTGSDIVSDVHLFSSDGRLIAEASGFRARRVKSSAMLKTISAQSLKDSLYRIDWDLISSDNNELADRMTQNANNRVGENRKQWLIVSGTAPLPEWIESIERQDISCRCAVHADKFKRLSQNDFELDLTDTEQTQLLFTAINDESGVIDAVVFRADTVGTNRTLSHESELSTNNQLMDLALNSCSILLNIVKNIVVVSEKVSPVKLTIITRGTQQTADKILSQKVFPSQTIHDSVSQTIYDSAAQIAQATLWGLARVIRLEHPTLMCSCIDLDPHTYSDKIYDDYTDVDRTYADLNYSNPNYTDKTERLHKESQIQNEVKRVAQLLASDSGNSDIALRQDKTLFASITKYRLPESIESVSLRSDATYIITGGLGALGRHLMGWLADRGARHILLLGRKKPDAELISQIEALSSIGVEVITRSADVSDYMSLSSVLNDSMHYLPLIRGVFHLAGVLDDGVLVQQDTLRIKKVMAPKLAGVWNLHQIMADTELDLFVCFSSVAGVIGSMGQGNYAAANSALDTFISWRRTQGLPGISLQWGPWADGGMASSIQDRDQQRFAGYGIERITPEDATDLMDTLLATENHNIAILPIKWDSFLKRLSGTEVPTLFRGLSVIKSTTYSKGSSATDSHGLANRLKPLSYQEASTLLDKHIRELVSQALGLPNPQRIGPRQRLFELGLDSLGAVELKNRLAATIGVNLRSTLLFDFPTLASLTEHIEQDVLGIAAESTMTTAATSSSRYQPIQSHATETNQTQAEELEGLSEDALAALLAEELKS